MPGGTVTVEVRATSTLGGTELLLRPRRARVTAGDPGLDAGLLADLRLLAAGETGRIGVAGPTEWVEASVPRLPSLVLGEDVRSAHKAAARAPLRPSFALQASADTSERAQP